MIKKTKLFLGLISMVSFSSTTAMAECVSNGWCDDVKITRLYAHSNGNIYIGTSGDEKRLNCTPVNGEDIQLSGTSPMAEILYSTLLTAKINDLTVGRIRIDPSESDCQIAYMWLD